MPKLRLLASLAMLAPSLFAQAPSNTRLPPAGIAVPEADRQELTANTESLRKEIDSLKSSLATQRKLLALVPDVEIFHKAVDWALRYDEFFDAKQIAFARTLLQQGSDRAKELREARTPWLDATGLVVRGYRSKVDGSVQPYGLAIPKDWKRGKATPLWVWLAGRNEKRTELAFLNERESGPGQFTPADTIVLHPYGRFCNATKFAGEVDVFEAMDAVRSQYPIDPQRLVVAGFSMGGASAWHLSTHYPGLWCAASPGAGFAETAVFARVFGDGKEPPPAWEQKLWRWYDATVYAGNLFNCPTIAYSGEIDSQKQAADIMEDAMAKEGLKLERLIGPQTAHKYHPDTQKELAGKLEALTAKGKPVRRPEIRFTTYTLRYPECDWVRVDGLEQHWERADVRAKFEGANLVTVTTTNVSALTLSAPGVESVKIDGQKLTAPRVVGGGVSLHKVAGKWQPGRAEGLRKRPGLAGPIDDAFMDSFLFVKPTGKAFTPQNARWTEDELARATKMWRDIFRGDAPVRDDAAISKEDIARSNLILWGDPSSNKLLARILSKLPLEWTSKKLVFNGKTYDTNHMPMLAFPNPLNPEKYVVLNSGIDFRIDAYGSNAKQTPKLPDWAIVDLRESAEPRWPGKNVNAGFFDEQWQLSKMLP